MTTNDEAFEKLLAVQRMTRALRRKSIADQGPLADHSRGQGRVMSLLKLKDGIATKDMAEILGIRVSSLNETLARMEKDGLIARSPSEADKRIMLVELTDAGKKASMEGNRAAAMAFHGLSEDELASFAGTLDTIAENLEAELGEDFQELMERGRRRRKEFFDGPPRGLEGEFPPPPGPGGRRGRGGPRPHDCAGGERHGRGGPHEGRGEGGPRPGEGRRSRGGGPRGGRRGGHGGWDSEEFGGPHHHAGGRAMGPECPEGPHGHGGHHGHHGRVATTEAHGIKR